MKHKTRQSIVLFFQSDDSTSGALAVALEQQEKTLELLIERFIAGDKGIAEFVVTTG